MKKILIIPALAMTLTLGSCSNWLDINTNPYASTTVEAGYLFNYSAVCWSATRAGGDSYFAFSMGGQVLADGGRYGGWTEAYYDFGDYAPGNIWVAGYANVAENLNVAIKTAQETGGQNNTVAQCMLLRASVFYSLTMIYGDIPFSEACNIEASRTPAFDAQQDILNGVIGMIDEALSLIDDESVAITNYDIYYKGDMDKWAKFGKSLKLRVLMTMVDKDNSKAAQIGAMVQAGGLITLNSDQMLFPFYTTEGSQNPTWRLEYEYGDAEGEVFNYMFPHYTVVDPMVAIDDPRLPVYFTESETEPGTYVGLKSTVDVPLVKIGNYYYAACSQINITVCPADAPDIVFSAWESNFLIAEAYARGLGVAQNLATAFNYYKAGVIQSCVFQGLDLSDANGFANSLSAFTSEQDALQNLAIQMRIASMNYPMDAWNTQRRMAYPMLTAPARSMATAFYRLPYPTRETNVNPSVPSKPGGAAYLVSDMMWFQSKESYVR